MRKTRWRSSSLMASLRAGLRCRAVSAAILCGVSVLTSCGAVKVVPPEATQATEGNAAFGKREVFVNPCNLVRKDEVERAMATKMLGPRLQRASPEFSFDTWCDFTSGLNGDVVRVTVDDVFDTKPTIDKGAEVIAGLAKRAAWHPSTKACCPGGYFGALTREKVYFNIDFESQRVGTTGSRRTGIDLGRRAVRRVAEQSPGDARSFPTLTRPPFDPCLVVSVADQVRELRWAGTNGRYQPSEWSTDPMSAEEWRDKVRLGNRGNGYPTERFGGGGGGSWVCHRSRHPGFSANFEVEVFKRPVSAEEIVATPVRPVDGLDRPAFVTDLPDPAAVPDELDRRAAIFFRGGSRLIALYLRDVRLSRVDHERHLIALARLATFRVGG